MENKGIHKYVFWFQYLFILFILGIVFKCTKVYIYVPLFFLLDIPNNIKKKKKFLPHSFKFLHLDILYLLLFYFAYISLTRHSIGLYNRIFHSLMLYNWWCALYILLILHPWWWSQYLEWESCIHVLYMQACLRESVKFWPLIIVISLNVLLGAISSRHFSCLTLDVKRLIRKLFRRVPSNLVAMGLDNRCDRSFWTN